MNEVREEKQADSNVYDVVVIGGGQAGLSLGFYLRRSGLRYVILDGQKSAGGAWLNAWDSLRLFSPAQWSSLPGWLFPGNPGRYPTRDEVISYLEQYEERYHLPIKRPVLVKSVKSSGELLEIEASDGLYRTRIVVSATGSWQKPFIPDYPGREEFTGMQIHSANYKSPEQFAGKRVLVVGAGNSGAQIMAEMSIFADATWATLEEPQFLPDDVDGRVLFDAASEKYRALTTSAAAGSSPTNKPKSRDLLGSIVMVEPVKQARERNGLASRRMFERFTENGVIWSDGGEEYIDAVIWCTGFKPALDFLEPLGVVEENGKVEVKNTRSIKEPRLWLVGYGNWTGFASATLIGVGRSARATVQEVSDALKDSKTNELTEARP
jgi:putative flavoprotein involved in K+ transport